ncbi:sirohydrochlorin chelatase [Streptomyces sp. SID5785]|uniref:sirohydrochlorin chelatase n=1 Tax=Streptomyces sp. SID5785 TaxID=2690309 RepID=UPI001F363090|nr:sirohydrochlorin chelatase [Streptomyces sp. SID5785]
MISNQLGTQLSQVSPRIPHTPHNLNAPRPPHGSRTPRPPHNRPPTLLLVAHGSRDPRALETVSALADRIRALRPGLTVRLGHIELNEPLLSDALAALPGGSRAVLVPLLLSRGHHVKHDIPGAAADAAHLRTRLAAPLGPHPLLAEALHDRLMEAGWPRHLSDRARRRGGVVLAAAGSRDPDAAADLRSAAGLLARRLGVPVLAAHGSAGAPDVAEALRTFAGRGRTRTAVASYFAAPGRFATRAAAAAQGIAAAPLGTHPALARLVLHRYDTALAPAPHAALPDLASA